MANIPFALADVFRVAEVKLSLEGCCIFVPKQTSRMYCLGYFLFLSSETDLNDSFFFSLQSYCSVKRAFFPSLICLYRLRTCLCPLGWYVLLGLDLDINPTNRSQTELTFLRTE